MPEFSPEMSLGFFYLFHQGKKIQKFQNHSTTYLLLTKFVIKMF